MISQSHLTNIGSHFASISNTILRPDKSSTDSFEKISHLLWKNKYFLFVLITGQVVKITESCAVPFSSACENIEPGIDSRA